MALTGRRLVAAMCVGQVGNLLPHVVVPAVMAQHLIPQWGLSASEAGLMAASYAVGYMLAVPVLTALTDRIDARLVLVAGSAMSGLATLARSVTLYTASFSLGVGLSFLIAQLAAERFGWRMAFVLTALGPLAMIAAGVHMGAAKPAASARRLLDFKPVFRNRPALGFILGYGAHCFELYALRTWIVAFWAYITAGHGGSAVLAPITVSVLAAVVAMPASILGNEAALRFGRHRAIISFMCIAGGLAMAIGLATAASPAILLALLLLYAIAIPADSGALTSGMSASAHPQHRGATMAMHSTLGFGLSAAGGWAVGVAIDAGGGMASASGWLAAFVVMGAGGLLGPLALWWSLRR